MDLSGTPTWPTPKRETFLETFLTLSSKKQFFKPKKFLRLFETTDCLVHPKIYNTYPPPKKSFQVEKQFFKIAKKKKKIFQTKTFYTCENNLRCFISVVMWIWVCYFSC